VHSILEVQTYEFRKRFKKNSTGFYGRQGDFSSAWSRFDEDMKNALNQEKLEETWINTIASAEYSCN